MAILRFIKQRLARFAGFATLDELKTLQSQLRQLSERNPALIERVARFVACEMIPGDYVEFGVYRGASFVSAYNALQQGFTARIAQLSGNAPTEHRAQREALWKDMRFFAFDSFLGLPELQGVDRESRDFSLGQYAASEQEFRAHLANTGMEMERVAIVPGWFQDTCTIENFARIGLQKIAVAWIDCDLYESAYAILEPITPLLQDGSIIIFDDWFAFRGHPKRGEQRAFYEWRQQHPELILTPFHQEGTWRMSFIVSYSR
jgi:O-methyltransferase